MDPVHEDYHKKATIRNPTSVFHMARNVDGSSHTPTLRYETPEASSAHESAGRHKDRHENLGRRGSRAARREDMQVQKPWLLIGACTPRQAKNRSPGAHGLCVGQTRNSPCTNIARVAPSMHDQAYSKPWASSSRRRCVSECAWVQHGLPVSGGPLRV